jgi:hypothetical protein
MSREQLWLEVWAIMGRLERDEWHMRKTRDAEADLDRLYSIMEELHLRGDQLALAV